MNGGELLSGITGFDDSDDFFSFDNLDSTQFTDCNPLMKGSIDDDIRMGMGSIKKE